MRRPVTVGTRHIYAMYRKKHKKDAEFPPVDVVTYRKILSKFGENFIKKVISNREGVDFPMDKGYLRITKWKNSVKPRERKDGTFEHLGWLPKDWTVRMDNGHAPPTLNDHSDGYKFRWAWIKTNSKLAHRTMMSFDIIRRWDRYLAQSIKAGKQDYYSS